MEEGEESNSSFECERIGPLLPCDPCFSRISRRGSAPRASPCACEAAKEESARDLGDSAPAAAAAAEEAEAESSSSTAPSNLREATAGEGDRLADCAASVSEGEEVFGVGRMVLVKCVWAAGAGREEGEGGPLRAAEAAEGASAAAACEGAHTSMPTGEAQLNMLSTMECDLGDMGVCVGGVVEEGGQGRREQRDGRRGGGAISAYNACY